MHGKSKEKLLNVGSESGFLAVDRWISDGGPAECVIAVYSYGVRRTSVSAICISPHCQLDAPHSLAQGLAELVGSFNPHHRHAEDE